MHIFDLMQPMFVNGTCLGKSWKKGFVSPEKPWNLGLCKSWKVLKKSILMSVRTLNRVLKIDSPLVIDVNKNKHVGK